MFEFSTVGGIKCNMKVRVLLTFDIFFSQKLQLLNLNVPSLFMLYYLCFHFTETTAVEPECAIPVYAGRAGRGAGSPDKVSVRRA